MESKKKSELEDTSIRSEKLAESSVAWDGSPLPPYPAVTPVVIMFYAGDGETTLSIPAN